MRLHRLSLRKKLVLSTFIAGCFAASAPQARAADYYWNVTGTQSWATGANWSDNAASGGTTGVTPLATDNATFNQSSVPGSSIVQIAAATGITNLTFNNTGTTSIESTTATIQNLTASGLITVATGAGGVAQFGLIDTVTPANNRPIRLAGAAGINITSGTLILNGTAAAVANTFTGNITVDGSNSILAINSFVGTGTYTTQNPLGTKAFSTADAYKTVTLTNGATFRVLSGTYNVNVPTATNIGAGQVFNIGTGGATFDVASGASFVLDDGTTGITGTGNTAQQLQGSGALTKTGTGTLTLRNQFNFGGTINIAAGLFQVSAATGGFGTTAAGTTIQSGAALNLNGQATTDAEPLNISGTGLAASPVGVITNAATANAAFAGPITLGAASQIGVSNTGTMTLSGAMTGAFPLTINNTGTGGTVLSGASTAFNSGILVSSGALRSGSSNGLGANTNVVTLGDTSTLSPAQPVVLDLNAAGTMAQPIVLATGAFTGGLSVGNSGTSLVTANATGGITGTNNLNLRSSGTQHLSFSGAAIDNVGSITNVGPGFGEVLINSNITANVTSVTQNSVGSNLTLAGTNAYTGSTTVSAGVLTFLNPAAIPGGLTPTQPITVASGGALGLGYAGAGQFTAANVTALLAGTFPNVTFAATGTGIALDTRAGDATYAPVIGNIVGTTSSGLVKTGINTLTVNPANTFNGPFYIQNGALSTSTIGNVGAVSSGLGSQATAADATINLGLGANTGRLIYTGTGETTDRVINILASTGGAAIEQAGTGNLLFTSATTFVGAAGAKRLTLAGSTTGTGEISGTIAGGIAGSPSPLTIAKDGTGTWLLSGAGNTATTLVMNGGVLNTGTNGLTLSNLGAATVQATANSTINGKIILGGVGPAANGADFGATVAGVTLTVNAIIEGGPTNNIDFWNQVTGTTILNGANTWSGPTRIAGQIVQVSSLNSVTGGSASSSLGAPTTIANGTIGLSGAATLRYAGTGETTDRVINLEATTTNGIIEQAGSGLLRFTSPFTATGAGSKSLILQGSTAGAGEINGAIVNNSGTNLTNLIKNGTGLWSLTGANTFTGTTTLNGGTLALAGASGISVSPTYNLNLGGTLLIDNLDTANNGNRLTDTAVINLAGGTLDFSNNGGAVNYSETAGALNVNAGGTGTINADQAAVGQTSALTLASLTRASGSSINFTGTGLGANTRNQVLITGQTAGPLPVWASYNTTGLAAYDTTNGIVEAAYTDIAARTDIVPNGAALNVRINSAGTPGNITLAASATTINSLLQNTATASTVDLAGGSIATTGIKINPAMQALTIGATAGDGTLSAATPGGDLSLINNSSNPLTINSSIVNNSSASTLSVLGGGVTTLAGTANTFTGNANVNGATLNVTGSWTGDVATTFLNYGNGPGNAIVNVSGNMTIRGTAGGSVAGGVGVYNQTAGLVTVSPGTGNIQFVASGAGYGYFNLTGGTYKNINRFDNTGNSGTAVAVTYIGGTGTLDNDAGEWMINAYGLGQMTVAAGGTITRVGATQPFGITMNNAASRGTLNVAGGTVDTGSQPIRFGNGNISSTVGFVNLAGGTLSMGVNAGLNNGTGTGNQVYFSFAGGTLRATGTLSSALPVSNASTTTSTTIFSAINNSAVATAPSFNGGLTVDTNGFATTIATDLAGATGSRVTQANLTLSGGTGYVGAPAVTFSNVGVLPGGTPAAGYALISGGAVTGIVITNPGTYEPGTVPTITLSGGGATSEATITSSALNTANVNDGDLNKIGAGNLIITGTNTYGGETNVNAGAVIGGSPASLPGYATPGKIIVAPGATIGGRVGGAGFTEADIATLATNATIPATAYLGISTQNGNYTYASAITGNYGLQKLEANTLTLEASNTYTGPTDVNAGILQVGNAGTTGTLNGAAISVNTGATLAFNRTNAYNLTAGNLVTGAGSIQLSSGGTVVAAVDNQFNTTGNLVFGSGANAATGGNLDLTASNSTFGGLLSQTNSTTANTITIGAGKTLTINGNVDMTNTVNNTTNLVTMTGGGALVINGATMFIGRTTGGTNRTTDAWMDLSGLASFNATLSGNLVVNQTGDNNANNFAQLILANNNTINAASVIVGGSSAGAGSATTPNMLKLGGATNVIKTDLVHLGSGTRDSGHVLFNGATGSVNLRNLAGTGRANMSMGPNAAQATAYTVNNLFDTTGHNADLAIGTLTTSLGAKTAANTHNLKFDTGTLDILTVNMAVAKGTGASTSKVEIGGGTALLGGSAAFSDTGTGSVNLATQGTGELAITGGTVTSSVDINRGTATAGSNAILTLNGGSLDMTNKNIGTAALPIDNINLQAGTLSNVAEINGGAAVSKTTAGVLNYAGNNAYNGATTVAAGTLRVNGTLPNSLVTVNAGATLGGSGTIGSATTVDGSVAPGNSIGTLNVTNNVTWNAGNAWVWELGTGGGTLAVPGTGDLLNITGNFVKGSGSAFTFDFSNTGAAGVYKLVDWSGTTAFAAGDFTASNLGSGLTSSFTVDSGTSALYLTLSSSGTIGTTYTLAAAPATLNILQGGTMPGSVTIANTGTGSADTLTFTTLTGTSGTPSVATATGSGNGGPLAQGASAVQNLTINGISNGSATITSSVASATNTTLASPATLSGSAGTISVNVGNASFSTLGDSRVYGNAPQLSTLASNINYTTANWSSNTTGLTASGGGPVALASTATILRYNNTTGGAETVSMQWRTRTTAEANPNQPNAVLSDIVNLTGMISGTETLTPSGTATGTGVFVLQMSYLQTTLDAYGLSENSIATSGELRLGWNDAGSWKTAGLGNVGVGGGTTTFVGAVAYDPLNPTHNVLGAYGVDQSSPTGGVVWAVLNHNSEFAVIPEPSTLVLGGLALLGFAGVGLRRRRLAKQGV